MLGQSARTYRGTLYLFRGGGLSSLRKRQFLLALRRWDVSRGGTKRP